MSNIRPRSSRRAKPSPNTDKLIHLASNRAVSTCRVEDAFWECRLVALVEKLFADNDEATLTAALDHLYGAGGRAYDELADVIEACCETRPIEPRGETDGNRGLDVVMIAAPVLAWSRLSIPTGVIAPDTLTNLRTHLGAHVLAANVRCALVNYFFSPDQLPQSYVATAQLAEKLARAALHERHINFDASGQDETLPFLSDVRYVLGAVAASRGQPLFRWQEDDGSRSEALRQWRTQGGEVLRPLLPACAFEPLLPQPYHTATREADRASRPYSLRAAVAFLQTTLNVAATNLRAIVAPFYDRQLEEFRIGFALGAASEIIHGVVWPLLENEDESVEAPAQIELVLKEAGLHQIVLLDERFPLEYCDDCGAPLFPNAEGEPVHAELPEEQAEAAPRHLH